MTRLRKMTLDEIQRRNYAQSTVRTYVTAIEDFARYFGKSPERLGPEHIRQYQVHLFRDRKLSAGTVEGREAALRFLYVKTLPRPYLPDQIPFPKRARRLPSTSAKRKSALLIDSAKNLMHRAILMTLYATGLRRAELCRLKVVDVERMVIHVREGKGGRDRDVLLSPKLLEILREYWRWMKPKTWLFPGMNRCLANEGLSSALDRASAYVEAGADMVFPEAVQALDQYKAFVERTKVPILANITEFGLTPLFTLDELRSAGVAIALYPLSAFLAMNAAALAVYQAIRREGTQKNVLHTMQTRAEL